MKEYDYYEAITSDIITYLIDNHLLNEISEETKDEFIDRLQDELWADDSITGNGGDGYDTEENCEEYICHNLNLLVSCAREFDYDLSSPDSHIAINWDSLIRCNLLYECIYNAVERVLEKKNEQN